MSGPLPNFLSSDRVNCGVAAHTDTGKLLSDKNLLIHSAVCSPVNLYNEEASEEEKKKFKSHSNEELNDGYSGSKIYTLRGQRPVKGHSADHTEVEKIGVGKSPMSQQYTIWLLGLEISSRLKAASRKNVPVAEQQALGENALPPKNFQNAKYNFRVCYKEDGDDDDDDDDDNEIEGILNQCLRLKLPVLRNSACPFGHTNHSEGGCLCLPLTESFSRLGDVTEFNELEITEQEETLKALNFDLEETNPVSGAEEEPQIILEWVPKKKHLQTEEYPIPDMFRFIFIIPPSSTVDFGSVVQEMISDFASKKRKSSRNPTFYQKHESIATHQSFLELVGLVMWKKWDQYTNPRINKETPNICKSEDQFVDGIKYILNFKHDMLSMQGSLHAVTKTNDTFKPKLHNDAQDQCFFLQSYYRNGKFCPKLELQRNMVLFTSDLLQKKNGIFMFLKKYNMWHLKEHLAYYNKRCEFENGCIEEKSTASPLDAPSNTILRNPMSANDEISSISQEDLMQGVDPATRNQLKASVKQWYEGEEGAALNMMRHWMLLVLSILAQEYTKVNTNMEKLKLYLQHITNGCKSLRRYSKRDDLFSSTKGAFDHVKVLSHKDSKHDNIETPWNPLCIGFRQHPAKNIGVLGMFIAELFYVAETLFYVSTHTGILLFCYVCTADAFCTRLNKNNWIFMGAPDGGKSFTSNQCKDLMLIAATVLMTTHQSEAGGRDISQMDYRNLMEEADSELLGRDPKFQKKRDEAKNRLTRGESITVKKCQVKDPIDDIIKWKTMQIITITNVQIGCATNDTQLATKGDEAVLSRFARTEIPIMKRLKGRRGVSDMNTAKQQQSVTRRRRGDQYSGQYQYFDSLRFLIYKCINLGILLQPEKTVFDLLLDQLKLFLKTIGISIASRTEDRMYGKAVSFMMLRIISTLFQYPEEDTELIIGSVPSDSSNDAWNLPNSEFLKGLRIHPDDMRIILDKILVKDHFENIRFVDHTGAVKKIYYVDIGMEKAFDKDRNPKLNLRTMQRSLTNEVWNFHCPKTCVGKFYKQWVSIHHHNFEEFIQTVSPMMVISFEDTLAAMWHTRSEYCPDKKVLFEKLLLDLSINVLKKDSLRDPTDETKRNKDFLQVRINGDQNSEQRTNHTFLLLGPLKEVEVQLQTNKNSKQGGFPEGTDIYLDKKGIREQLLQLRNVKDQQGYQYVSASRIVKARRAEEEDKPYFGCVKLQSGHQLPDWQKIGSDGLLRQETIEAENTYRNNFTVPRTFARDSYVKKKDLAYALYAQRQRKYPNGHSSDGALVRHAIYTQNKQSIIHISETNGKVTDTSKVYVNMNYIEQAIIQGKARENLEDMHDLHKFFKSLGYKHDGIKISQKTADTLIKKKKEKYTKLANESPSDRAYYKQLYKMDKDRISKLVTPHKWEQGKTVLLGTPFLGYAKDNNGKKQVRVSQPCISHCVVIPHSERDLSTENANVPSKSCAGILGINIQDTKKEKRDVHLPLNALGFCKHLQKLCYFPDNVTENDFYDLYNLKVKIRSGKEVYLYRWACPDEINRQIHKNYKGKYTFENHYPFVAAWKEEKSYDCKKIIDENGQEKWVPYNNIISPSPNGHRLSKDILNQIAKDFPDAIFPENENDIVCVEEEREILERQRSLERQTQMIQQMRLSQTNEDEDVEEVIDVDEEGDDRGKKRRKNTEERRVYTAAEIEEIKERKEMEEYNEMRREVEQANDNMSRAEQDPLHSLFGSDSGGEEGGLSWEQHEQIAQEEDDLADKRAKANTNSFIDDEAEVEF